MIRIAWKMRQLPGSIRQPGADQNFIELQDMTRSVQAIWLT
jgi:hypothetical protein